MRYTNPRLLYFTLLVSSTRHGPSQFSILHLALTARDCVQNRDFCLPYLHSAPPLGGGVSSEYRHNVWCGKLEWCGYPMVQKFEGTIISFDRMYECDRRTDRQTPHDGI